MGIRGLNAYLSPYCEPYKLHNTLIIMDGGLAISVCLGAQYDPRFGGNYQKIYDHTCEIFNRFKSCNVTPIVLADGRFKEEKAGTMRKRYDGKLQSAISYKDNRFPLNKAAGAISLLYYNAFRHALNDLGIPFCSTEFEADEEMMELARKLNCPVVSCDSDFYLSDGVTYVHWDSIDFKSNPSSNYLNCFKFERERFLMREGVSPSVFPFLSVLFISDYSNQELHQRILRGGRREDQFQQAMFWLKGKTAQQVLQEMTSKCLPPNASQDVVQGFQNKINISIRSYTDCKTTVVPILERNEMIRPYLRNVRFNIQKNDVIEKYNVPSYIINKIKECRLTSTILDFFVSDEFECKTMICEDVDEESAHAPSIRLIEGIYGILSKYIPEKPGMRLIIRNFRTLGTRDLKPLVIRNTDPYKILYEITEIKEDLVKHIRIFDEKWMIFIVTLIYWRKCQDKIDDFHVHSIILTAFVLHITQIRYLKSDDNLNFPLNGFHDLNENDYLSFVNRKILSCGIPKHNGIILDSISHIHLYLSLQACLHRSMPLFQLLNLSYDIRVSDFICGDFYHMIYNEMKRNSNCLNYVDELFRGFDRLRSLYGLIISNRAVADLL